MDHRKVHDDGQLQLSAEHMNIVAEDVFAGFNMMGFTGTHSRAISEGVTTQQPQPVPTQTQAAAGSGDFLGIFQEPPKTPQKARPPQATPKKAAVSPSETITKRHGGNRKPSVSAARQAQGQQADSSRTSSSAPALGRSAPGQQGQQTEPIDALSLKRGRPKRRVIDDCDKIVVEFVAADKDSIQFFGQKAMATTQWLARLQEAFEEQLKEADLADDSRSSLVIGKKKVDAIMTLCRAARKSGVESEGFLDIAFVQTQFLDKPPAVETNVFPFFIRKTAMRTTIERANCDAAWWALLSPAALSRLECQSFSSIMEMQSEFIAHKIISLQESADSVESFAEKFSALFTCEHACSTAQLDKDALEQVHALRTIVQASTSVVVGDGGGA